MNKTGAKAFGGLIMIITAFLVYYILTSEWFIARTFNEIIVLVVLTPIFAVLPDIFKRYSIGIEITLLGIMAIIIYTLAQYVSPIVVYPPIFGFIFAHLVISIVIDDNEYIMNEKSVLAKTTVSMVIAGIILAYLQYTFA